MKILEFTLPYVSPSEKPRVFRPPAGNDTDTTRPGKNFDDAMRLKQPQDRQSGGQPASKDDGNAAQHEPEAQPERKLPKADAETTAEKAQRIEIELFVGQMLKQMELPEQSATAVKALTGTLAEFIQAAMNSGSMEEAVEGKESLARNLEIPDAFQDSEIVAFLAPARFATVSPAGGQDAQAQTPPPSTVATDIPPSDIEVTVDADDAPIAKTSPAVDPQVQTPQKSMAAATPVISERQQLDAAPVEAPRETREGDRQQMSAQRSESVAPDLSRMQRVNNTAGISQHHNGILIADSGNKTYEIRFASAELGQIRVELSMDGAKPEASVLYNNADAEKPLRDLFGSLQTRMANLGIENLSLRQDTGRNPGGDDTSGNQKIAGGNAVDSTADASEITYYIAPEMIDAGRLDIRF